jgi:hypothetical protein
MNDEQAQEALEILKRLRYWAIEGGMKDPTTIAEICADATCLLHDVKAYEELGS